MTRKKYINKPFDRLTPKVRAVFILHLAGFSTREIESVTDTDHKTVSRWILRAYEEYDDENDTNLPLLRAE